MVNMEKYEEKRDLAIRSLESTLNAEELAQFHKFKKFVELLEKERKLEDVLFRTFLAEESNSND